MPGRGERRLSLQEAGAYEKAPTEVGALRLLVARTRFELVISALRGRRPKPLDERAIMAGMEGVEPPLTEPESAVLPLDDIPVASRGNPRATKYITAQRSGAQGVNLGDLTQGNDPRRMPFRRVGCHSP